MSTSLRAAAALLSLTCLAACGRAELLHGLDERQANEVLVALAEAGLAGDKARDPGAEQAWQVEVPAAQAARAQRLLADRALPRPRPPGLGEVFGEGSMVPTAVEEQARFALALSGELARSLESLDGVVGARVHLALPGPDRLGLAERPRPRAAVLLRCRPAACPGLRALEPGLRALVAGAAQGLEAGDVAVVIAPAPEAPAPPAAPSSPAPLFLALASAAALGAVAALGAGLRARLRRGVRA